MRHPLLPRLAAVLIAVTAATASMGGGVPVAADHGDAAAVQAAREIQAARDRANAAAQALFDAESEIDTLTIDIADAEKKLAAVEKQAADMKRSLEISAVRRFTQSGGTTFVLFGDLASVNEGLTAEVYAAVTQEAANIDLDDYDAVIDDVESARGELENQKVAAEAATVNFAALEKRANEEIVKLAEVEKERLIDEAVEHELARQRRERAAAEAAAAEAAAAQAARTAAAKAANSGGGSGGSTTGGSSSGGSTSGGGTSGGSTSGGGSGGSTSGGTSGGGSTSGGGGTGAGAGNGMACPVNGPHAFANTWGAPRSGGRSHQGVDMISPSGTSLVAVESGSVRFSNNRLGGNAAWVTGNSGTTYYYAHLRSFTGSSRSVSKGEEIGKVGSTGNAGTPHLHFEVHPGGGRAVNPYPYVAAVC